MASKAITYVWKIPRPTIDKAAMDLMGAAYQTATKTDPNVTTVLIRSHIHATTWRNGKIYKDDPHLTISSKNGIQEEQKTHETAHGYTVSLKDPTLVRVKPSEFVKPDDTKDPKGNEIWPAGLPAEVVMHTEP